MGLCSAAFSSSSRVNPKRLAFELDDESKKYDLPEFLRDHVVGASDVAGALAQVEPLYSGYRRTVQALQTYVELAKRDDGEKLPAPAAPKKTISPGDTGLVSRGSRVSCAWWAIFRPTPMFLPIGRSMIVRWSTPSRVSSAATGATSTDESALRRLQT